MNNQLKEAIETIESFKPEKHGGGMNKRLARQAGQRLKYNPLANVAPRAWFRGARGCRT